ncbi:hypothetical protein L596_006779 [Steinernema carpocapsae]|uniref:Uncharacterized protein n=1 Tax=Steinernema carpocapsae TaxID=34508 RepID=A0A4U5P7J1_STECR|nr:hypothetical protein L596_006779 [Steinernema carpocapsae]
MLFQTPKRLEAIQHFTSFPSIRVARSVAPFLLARPRNETASNPSRSLVLYRQPTMTALQARNALNTNIYRFLEWNRLQRCTCSLRRR